MKRLMPASLNQKTTKQKLTTIHKVVTQKPIITHKERAALILFLTGGFTIGLCFTVYKILCDFKNRYKILCDFKNKYKI